LSFIRNWRIGDVFFGKYQNGKQSFESMVDKNIYFTKGKDNISNRSSNIYITIAMLPFKRHTIDIDKYTLVHPMFSVEFMLFNL
jgi:hypothetical protein